jgi:X-Pro dipeptidyl-peptidase
MLGRGRSTLALVCALLAMPAPAAAEPVFETYKVPTVGGAEINVEVMRPEGDARAPVILTYSPYNTLSETNEPNLANDDLGRRYVERGYARAVADVLGTRNSSGCWDYGGADEQQSGVDLVNFLSSRPWSNGKVAMIGGSYDGTTANMVAARGDDAPGLAAIVPIAAISRWYGYAYGDGVRYFLNSDVPTDEGFDTPLAFDFGLARTPPTDPADPAFAPTLASRANPCESVEHTLRGYDRDPDYDEFWLERDYLKNADEFRAAVLVAHGWQDYNVKQDEGVRLFEALDGVPFKRAYLFQGTHETPSSDEWLALQDAFFDHTLMGVDNGVDDGPAVVTEGRTIGADGYESAGFREEESWPPAGTRRSALRLGRGVATWTDTGASTEEMESPPGALFFEFAPLKADTRLAGRAVLDAYVRPSREGSHLTPVLVDIAPDGTRRTVARGFLNLDYRDGLGSADPAPGEWVRARATLLPQDFTFPKGHRIGLLVMGSNTVWALPGTPGSTDIQTSRSRLRLPLADVR